MTKLINTSYSNPPHVYINSSIRNFMVWVKHLAFSYYHLPYKKPPLNTVQHTHYILKTTRNRH